MTDEETRERSELYAQYIREFREQTEATLKRVRVEQEDGSVNVIVIRDGSVHMDYSSCENQLCVQQGSVSAKNRFFRALGSQIVCLPNRVMIELEGGGNLPQGDLPDV